MATTFAKFNIDFFEGALTAHGYWYRWSRALPCPCEINSDTGAPRPDCSRCLGTGWRYVSPEAGRDRYLSPVDYLRVQVLFSDVKDDPKQNDTLGPYYGMGSATLTVAGAHRVGFRDRFVAEEQIASHAELLNRRGDSVVVGKSGRSTAEQISAMRYEPIRINYVEADQLDNTPLIYFEGVDFIVQEPTPIGDEPRKIVWIAGHGPDEGQQFTVHYDFHPVWIVDSFTYGSQQARGTEHGTNGPIGPQLLPTTFRTRLDWITPMRGS